MELGIAPGSPEVGNYFIANYPPFSVWKPQNVPAAIEALDAKADRTGATPLGLYLHIPFCRQRCKFCYFRVYTDKNSNDVDTYIDALARETELYAQRSAFAGRDFDFVYFGGGTPSFLSSEQLSRLIERIPKHWQWDAAREVTFECEPGTFRKSKLETIKAIGVTRLSLGVEHFDDDVLTLNGRGHKSPDVFRAYDIARDVGFDHVNIDLIAGMLGDTEAKWKEAVATALRIDPDSVTIYQLELPHNTVFVREAKESGKSISVADTATKRARVDYAFRQFEQAGYVVSSAYTVVKPAINGRPVDFVYRDALWRGSDMIGTGVASFSHVGGVHFQNADDWETYVSTLQGGELPIARALRVDDHQRLIREFALQLKLGRIDAAYFRDKFSVEVSVEFAEPIQSLVDDGYAQIDGDEMRLTRSGLLCADGLMLRFFEPQYRSIRYT